MFAVVRTGGKQYRVAAGDKIAVEKLAGDAGSTITLGDVMLAGEGDTLADAAKVIVSAEIIAQARSEKVVVFKKRRRHNYRRKAGHRQSITLLRILSVGDDKYEKKATAQAEVAPQAETAPVVAAAPQVETAQVTDAPAAAEPKATKAKTKAAAPAKDTGTAGEGMVDAPAKKKPAAKKSTAPQGDSNFDSAAEGAADSE
jgi:large subunit ribosomal protein L21